MIQKLTITGLWRNDKDQNGNPFRRASDGSAYEKLTLRAEKDYGKEYLRGFSADWNRNWKIGDSVVLKIEKKSYQGKEYLNFSRVSDLELRVIDLEGKVEFLLTGTKAVEPIESEPEAGTHIEEAPDDIKAEDMPF